MKEIYSQIINEGVMGVADECGSNEKGENLALLAQIEMIIQLTLFPEMLTYLKKLRKAGLPLGTGDISNWELDKLIAIAKGGK